MLFKKNWVGLLDRLKRFSTEDVGSNLEMPAFFAYCTQCEVAHRTSAAEDRQRGPLLAPPCAWGLRAGACKRCGGWFGPNFSAPARVRSKDGPPAVTRACCLRAASQWRLAIVCIPSKVVSKVLRSSAVVRALQVPVDRLCLRLSSASGCAHRKNGDLRTCYALAASSYRHAT